MIFTMVLVSACTPAPTPTPTPGSTAPTVISTSPGNVSNVPANSIITATFSEPVNPSTVTAETFTLKQGATSVAGRVTYSGTTATFTPATGIQLCTTYTAAITTGVKTMAGNSLASNYVWNFYTACSSSGPGVGGAASGPGGGSSSYGGGGGSGGGVSSAGGTSGVGSPANPVIPIVAPKVLSTSPVKGASGVNTCTAITVTFDLPIIPLAFNNMTFTLRKQGNSPVSGQLNYFNNVVTFTPDVCLEPCILYTATLTAINQGAGGNLVTVSTVWTFTTACPSILGSACPFAILAYTGVTGTASTTVTGDIGLYPYDRTFITGFPLTLHPTGTYSTSPLVTGKRKIRK